MISVVQFVHSGCEHIPSKREVRKGIVLYDWNYSAHKRKFLKSEGLYVDVRDNCLKKGNLYFWGEWEPWSKIKSLPIHSAIGDFPHFVHAPIYFKDPIKYPPFFNGKKQQHRQNTDPFVFGDDFFFSVCKQRRKTGATKLTCLSCGSIILFGSSKCKNTPNAYFALDTVLVVSEHKKYTVGSYNTDLNGFIPPNYVKIMGFKDWPSKTNSFVAYKGASFANPYEGMYSFVPCKIGDNGKNGFERPKITNKELKYITDNLPQGFKTTSTNLSLNKKIWSTVCKIIEKQGFCKGVKMDYEII